MKRIFFLVFIIYISILWNKKSNGFQIKRRGSNKNELSTNTSSNSSNSNISSNTNEFSFLGKSKEEESGDDNNKEKEENNNETKQENANDKQNEQTNEEQHTENTAEEKTVKNTTGIDNSNTDITTTTTNNNVPVLGTHDSQGNFVPSFQLLSNEILSANNALERSSQFLKIACSHILKILEFIPEEKIDAYYVKIDSKNMYLKEIGSECHKLYFSVEKLSMSVIVLNSKLYKFVFTPAKQ